MKKTAINAFRWMLVLPVTVFAHVISYNLYLWLGEDVNISFFKYVEIIMAFVVSGGVSIIAGSLTAPNHNKTTAIVLCTVVCTLMVIGLIVMISKFDNYGILGVLGNVGNIIGAIVGVYIISEQCKS